MAGSRSFERGDDYFADGRVHALTESEGQVTAQVRGTREYHVKLWAEEDGLGWSCTCPLGAEGTFCKHGVAVGLACLEQADAGSQGRAAKPAVTMEDVRAHLLSQDKKALVGLVLERAREDDRLREWLLLGAAKQRSKGLDLAAFRRAIDRAVNTGEYVDYHAMGDYVQGIEDVIRSLEELLQEGYADEVIKLAEHFLAGVEDRLGEVDDSDGLLGDILVRLQEIHHAACRKAKPDPEALARRLFEWELRTEWDTFLGAAETYADVLGAQGLAVYRRLAEAEWAGVPALGPGQRDAVRYGRRFRITHIMETLAGRSGDLEALVAVKARDLSFAYAFLEIAQLCKQARRYDQALAWAEGGVKAFPVHTDGRLRDFLAEEYHRRKRHEEALALIWAEFAEEPCLETYRKLRAHADRIAQGPSWKERALAFLRETLAKAMKDASRKEWAPRGRSELVKILLWEKDVETAWREAKEGGCSDELWLELAARREKDHPEEALPVYQGLIDPLVNQKHNEAYREAVRLLGKVGELMRRLGRRGEFDAYLEGVRAAHKPKRNLMKLIGEARWPTA